jgi:hypothetical protein
MDYDWSCPGCNELVSWIESSYYSEELDDNVCYECRDLLGERDVPDGSYQVASDNIRDDA